MAGDLSKLEQRTTQQDRVTRNRSSMFRPQNTDAPALKAFANLRSASRGDGGADELRRVLGLVKEAASDFQSYAENADAVRKDKESAGGGLAEEAGAVDPVLLETSKAYRDGVMRTRTERDWAVNAVQIDQEVRDLIQDQTDPDPAVRLAEVNTKLDERFAGLAIDPETNELKDVGAPATQRWLAAQMGEARRQVLVRAAAQIEKRMGEESLNNRADTWRTTLAMGGRLEWSSVFDGLLPSVDRKDALNTLLLTVKSTAAEIEEADPARSAQILDGLLGFEARQRREATPAEASAGAPAVGQLVSPFSGFSPDNVRSRVGAPRSGGSAHNGEDFPAPVGTPIVAPMGGEIVGSYKNARGGNQVLIRMDNGVTLGFAHLSERKFQKGARVEAGSVIGLSGNTGKSTGPHVHMTATVGGKKVSPSEYFRDNPSVAAGAPEGAPEDPSGLEPDSPSELANVAGPAQITPPSGPLTLSPEQRLDLQEFRRGLRNRIDARADRERKEVQGRAYDGFVGRLAGVGAYPTITEAQEAMRRGDISPQMLASIANTIESDARQDRAEARAVVSEAREDRREAKVDTVDRVSNEIMGRVYRGELSITEATGELGTRALSIADREVRQAVVNGVRGELEDARALRLKGPEYSRADTDFKRWAQTYAGTLGQRQLGRPGSPRVTTEAARREIQSWIDEWVVPLGRGDIKPEAVPGYMKQAEEWLDRRFDARFPRRATPKK